MFAAKKRAHNDYGDEYDEEDDYGDEYGDEEDVVININAHHENVFN